MVGDENTGRYSGRDFILASDRDAALAITVFAKFWIAVITSSYV